jgi:hypothetical protein
MAIFGGTLAYFPENNRLGLADNTLFAQNVLKQCCCRQCMLTAFQASA